MELPLVAYVPLAVALSGAIWTLCVARVVRGPDRVRAALAPASPPAAVHGPGYKAAQVVVGPRGARLLGLRHASYAVEDVATCERRVCRGIAACTCGFHAYARRDDARALAERLRGHPARDWAVATVELAGRVVVHERGSRASHQRVMQVAFPRRCHTCARHGRVIRAAGLAADPRDRRRLLLTSASPGQLTRLGHGGTCVRALCARHLTSARGVIALPDLAGLLGTDVTWYDTTEQEQ